ncbi:NYN domain-containing protein [Candidatus Pacearchaeota archaeon]|nr:NYN domain-containing protein [Candidatus Pacearchaeota archaeon]
MTGNSEKRVVFIDGGYFNKILKKYFKKSEINYFKLSEVICKKCDVNRLRTYFYHCLPIIRNNNAEDIIRKANMQKFLANLKRLPRFEVKLGKLQVIGDQFRQKMVDVLMSLDITSMCYENRIQHIILIAGDADFVPAIKKAKDCGTIIHLYYHPSSVHNELLDEVDELHEINEDLINECKS